MNVLIYTSKSSYTSRKVGGAETSLRLLAETLAIQGHSVIYATTSERTVLRCSRETIRGVQVLFLPSVRNGRIGRYLPLWLVRRVDALVGGIRRIPANIDLHSIDIVHVFYQIDPARFFLRLRHQHGYRLVMRMAGLDWYEHSARRASVASEYESIFNSVDSINFISRGLVELCYSRAKEVGIQLSPRDSFVLDIGVDHEISKMRWKGSSRQRGINAVSVGRFSDYQKRQDLLVEALSLLHRKNVIDSSNFELAFIGDGSERRRIERLIEQREVHGVCRVISYLPQRQLWNTLQTADLLCHPCEYEGLGKIIAEAMTMGLPVLASNVRPLNQIIDHERNGFLAENTPEAWAESLEQLIFNADRRISVSEAAQAFARTHYDPQRNANCYVEEFERIMRISRAS